METFEYFIGLKRQSGEWRWLSNDKNKSSSRGYLNWAPGQPSGNGNCAKMFISKKAHLCYDDVWCDRRNLGIGYICERFAKCNDKKGMSQAQDGLTFSFVKPIYSSFAVRKLCKKIPLSQFTN